MAEILPLLLRFEANQLRLDGCTRHHEMQPLGQLIASFMQRFQRHGRQAFKDEPHMIELWRWEMQPGELFESPGHPQGTFELFHVEQGQLKVKVDKTELTIPEGCSAVAKTDVPHHYANEGDSKLVFTMTVAELHQLQTIL